MSDTPFDEGFDFDLTDPAAFEGTERKPAPIGEYVLEISGKVVRKENTKAGGYRMVVPMSIVDESGKRQHQFDTVFYNINEPTKGQAEAKADHDAKKDYDEELYAGYCTKMRMAGEFFTSFGIDFADRSLANADTWKGRRARATLKVEEYEGSPSNDVNRWLGPVE